MNLALLWRVAAGGGGILFVNNQPISAPEIQIKAFVRPRDSSPFADGALRCSITAGTIPKRHKSRERKQTLFYGIAASRSVIYHFQHGQEI
jgi:hypothetical protein